MVTSATFSSSCHGKRQTERPRDGVLGSLPFGWAATMCLADETWLSLPSMVTNAAFTGAKRESHNICDTSVAVGQHFQLTKAIMSDRNMTVRNGRNLMSVGARKQKPTNCMAMFIERMFTNTSVEEVKFSASCATIDSTPFVANCPDSNVDRPERQKTLFL